MLRREFGGQVNLVEDAIGANRSLKMHNLWLLSLASISSAFISVQGGTSYLLSYFGGVHIAVGGWGAGPDKGFRPLGRLRPDYNETGRDNSSEPVAGPHVLHARTNRELLRLAREHM